MCQVAGLYLWVEGIDDQRLVETILSDCRGGYEFVKVQPYRGMKEEKIHSFLRAIDQMGADAIFFGDRDQSPCISSRVAELRRRYQVPSRFPVVVVCKMIEGWYLAGLPDLADRRMWRGDTDVNVELLTKQAFNAGRPPRFGSRIEWMVELLDKHVRDTAVQRTSSFGYACRKLGLR